VGTPAFVAASGCSTFDNSKSSNVRNFGRFSIAVLCALKLGRKLKITRKSEENKSESNSEAVV